MTMTKATKLNHKMIGALQGGGIGFAIDAAIREVLADCDRRPGLIKPRTVTIKLTLTPAGGALQEGGSGLGTVGVKAAVATTVPGRSGEQEFLNVGHDNTEDGEVEIVATFAQDTLFGREGN